MLCNNFIHYIKYKKLDSLNENIHFFFYKDHCPICAQTAACYSYLQCTTELNGVRIIYYSYSEVWSLQEFFEQKAIFQDFAAWWERKEG